MTVTFSQDTIAAIITPPGEGGIAAIRIAGPRSQSIATKHFRPAAADDSVVTPFLLRYGHFIGHQGVIIDEVMLASMPEGRSYTGLQQVEIFCHGGRVVVNAILNELLNSGARAAEPGEFTRLAFLSGRIDLTKAEAVAELIGAQTKLSYETARDHLLGRYTSHIGLLRQKIVDILAVIEAAIDFPEESDAFSTEDVQTTLKEIATGIQSLAATYTGGRILREGYTVAIAGRPNVGKSSLFNLLLRQERAIVTPMAGTTRDYLSEWIDLGGLAVRLIDTAGLRQTGGKIEKAGQATAKKIIADADLLLWMIDLSDRRWAAKIAEDINTVSKHVNLLMGNKIDICTDSVKRRFATSFPDAQLISCLNQQGIDSFKTAIHRRANEQMPDLTFGVVVTSARHQQKLRAASQSLRRAHTKLKIKESPEIIAFEIRQAVNHLDEITGKIYSEEVLESIFSKFCIGK
ncbi:MAG TPA: tRNA uridine-5-carboxymethylaminomethyl(34) synthesis GTPase MnmE [Candidatus Deferrimicrobium sp.]|nr:tRNA uridine-5-carboxymethylaminomethyl(34) synthesis GTPase MnmE [Candidatus Deferrimicrobium sp.]